MQRFISESNVGFVRGPAGGSSPPPDRGEGPFEPVPEGVFHRRRLAPQAAPRLPGLWWLVPPGGALGFERERGDQARDDTGGEEGTSVLRNPPREVTRCDQAGLGFFGPSCRAENNLDRAPVDHLEP